MIVVDYILKCNISNQNTVFVKCNVQKEVLKLLIMVNYIFKHMI